MKNYRKKIMTISVTEEVYEILKSSSNNMSSFICDLVKENHYKQMNHAVLTESSTSAIQSISAADLIRKLRDNED